MKSIIIAFTLLLAFVSCQTNIVSITSPLSNSEYTAGTNLIISWINPTVDTIPSIILVNGPATALQPVSTIAQNVDAKSGSYSWSIPADITPGQYALQLGTSPSISYSGFFTIKAATGGSSSQSGTASATATASSSAASSTSGSVSASASSSAASSSALSSSSVLSSSSSLVSSSTPTTSSTTSPSTTPNTASNKKATSVLLAAALIAAAALI